MGRLAAVESLARNLDCEDSEAKRWGKQFENIDGSCGGSDQPDQESEAMRILAAGDVTVYQNEPPKPTPPELPVIRDDQASVKKKPVGALTKLAIGGALLASGAGLASAPWLLGAFDKPDPPAASTGYEYLGRVFDPGPSP